MRDIVTDSELGHDIQEEFKKAREAFALQQAQFEQSDSEDEAVLSRRINAQVNDVLDATLEELSEKIAIFRSKIETDLLLTIRKDIATAVQTSSAKERTELSDIINARIEDNNARWKEAVGSVMEKKLTDDLRTALLPEIEKHVLAVRKDIATAVHTSSAKERIELSDIINARIEDNNARWKEAVGSAMEKKLADDLRATLIPEIETQVLSVREEIAAAMQMSNVTSARKEDDYARWKETVEEKLAELVNSPVGLSETVEVKWKETYLPRLQELAETATQQIYDVLMPQLHQRYLEAQQCKAQLKEHEIELKHFNHLLRQVSDRLNDQVEKQKEAARRLDDHANGIQSLWIKQFELKGNVGDLKANVRALVTS